ncbi:MAG: hypothetical protein ABIG32_02025 [Candidatus Uhrbacteria bacterium]|nr:hypothetical protein [Patescibacteria group bacterium]MBU1906622.1 hypothetical protein [Patescibacteria group bacterium]
MFGKKSDPEDAPENGSGEENGKSQSGEPDPAPFKVLVEMESLTTLGNPEPLVERLRGKLQGQLHGGGVFAEMGARESLAPCVRRFALTDGSDYGIFVEAVTSLPGVIGVKKIGEAWVLTEEERALAAAEQMRIDEDRERQAREAYEERAAELEEYKTLKQATDRSDEDRFGPAGELKKLCHDQFETWLAERGTCEVEIHMTTSDIMAGGFMGFQRQVAELPGFKAIRFFEEAINGELALPFNGKTPFAQIPFQVEYREAGGKHFAHLMIGAGRPTFMMAHYELYVREQ